MKATTQAKVTRLYVSDLEPKLCDLSNLVAITAEWAEGVVWRDAATKDRMMFLIYELDTKINDLKTGYYAAREVIQAP